MDKHKHIYKIISVLTFLTKHRTLIVTTKYCKKCHETKTTRKEVKNEKEIWD